MGARTIIEAEIYGEPSGNYVEPDAPQGMERVVAAAVKDMATGDVWLDDAHEECFQSAAAVLLPDMDRDDAVIMLKDGDGPAVDVGFWPSNGRFVSREDALEVAKKGRQGYDPRYDYLDSADLTMGA